MENNEAAIIELQTKLAFQEDLLDSLNQVVTDQQSQIAKLERTVAAMVEQMHSMQSSQSASRDNDPQQEIPPHY